MNMPPTKGLLERLRAGERVLIAEGYIFAFEKLCYIKAGPFVPEVVVDHPELVRQMHRDFVRAGSDVVQALTYYASRAKMSVVSREDELEKANRLALRIAREVADETGTLMAGDISNTGEYDPCDEEKLVRVKGMFKEQVEWAVSEGADYIVAETFHTLGEALLALEVIKEYGQGLPAVVTLTPQLDVNNRGQQSTADGIEFTEALGILEAAGADVVGYNCARGPDTMLPLLEDAKRAGIKVPLAVLPVPYRTTPDEPTFMTLTDPNTGKRCFPEDLDCRLCNRTDITRFGERCAQLGIQYVGLCCGNSPHLNRSLAESLGRRPEASRFSPDMSVHMIFGTDKKVVQYRAKGISAIIPNGHGTPETKINGE